MANIVLVYASMSGNTEVMALDIAKAIRESGEEVDVMEAFETDASILTNYDGILIGTYTWGDGDLPDELLDFYDELHDLDLTGKSAAVFGSFDWSYMDGGIAVDMVKDRLQEQGAEIVQKELKVELDPDPDDRVECRKFGNQFVMKMAKVKN